MAEELLEPAAEQDLGKADAGYGDKFEGYTAEQKDSETGGEEVVTPAAQDSVDPTARVHASVSRALAGARKVAEGSGMLQGSPVDPQDSGQAGDKDSPAPMVVDAAKVKEHSSKWAQDFELQGLFVVEGREKIVADTLGKAMLTQMGMRLVKTVPNGGSLFLKVGSGVCLQVLSLGENQVVFGALLASPLAGGQLDELSGVLRRDLA